MKHWRKSAIGLLLWMFIFSAIAGICVVEAAPKEEEIHGGALEVKFTFGFQEGDETYFKIGNKAPALIQVKNNGKDVKGEVQIEVANGNGEYVVYAAEADLAAGVEKIFQIPVKLTTFVTKLNVRIVDTEGHVLYQKRQLIGTPAGYDNMTVGFLSDGFDQVKYLAKSLDLGRSRNVGIDTVRLTEDNFPEDWSALNTFNIIAIDNYDTTRLSEQQYGALKDWVNRGGMLILGTGAAGSRTLGIFGDDFIQGKIGDLYASKGTALTGYVGVEGLSGQGIQMLELLIEGGRTIVGEDNWPVVAGLRKGLGSITIFAFDLADPMFAGWSQKDVFLNKVAEQAAPANLLSFVKEDSFNEYLNGIQRALDVIPELKNPKTSHLFVLFVLYILLVAPVSYFILKKKGKRERMWIVVPALSLVFTVVLFAGGYGNRIRKPIANVISVARLDGNHAASVESYAGIYNPNSKDIIVEGSKGETLGYMTDTYRYHNSDEAELRTMRAKIITSPRDQIIFYHNMALEKQMVSMESEHAPSGGLDADLTLKGNSLVGTVKNNTGMEIQDGLLIANGRYFHIGNLKEGETLPVDLKGTDYLGSSSQLSNTIFEDQLNQYYQKGKLSEQDFKAFLILRQRSILARGLLQSPSASGTGQFLGWSDSGFAGDILVNGSTAVKYERTAVVADLTIGYDQSAGMEIPFGQIVPKVDGSALVGNFYDASSMSGYGDGTISAVYTLPKGMDVNQIEFREIYEYGGSSASNQMQRQILRVDTGEFEDQPLYDWKIKDADLLKYIGADGSIQIKYQCRDKEFQLPQIRVRGVMR